jgi:hypothetical protein
MTVVENIACERIGKNDGLKHVFIFKTWFSLVGLASSALFYGL